MSKVTKEMALKYHRNGKPGKIEVVPTKPYSSQSDLSLAYSPGVAFPCLEIEKNPNDANEYTSKGNLVAVISNGTAVLGLGDIGALAGKPVMEGKALLFKIFAGLDCFDIEVNEKDPKKFIEIVKIHGGNTGFIETPERYPASKYKYKIEAGTSGYVNEIDTFGIGMAALELGAGRRTKEDVIDPKAGIIFNIKAGDFVNKDTVIAEIFTDNEEQIISVKNRILNSVKINNVHSEQVPLIRKIIF